MKNHSIDKVYFAVVSQFTELLVSRGFDSNSLKFRYLRCKKIQVQYFGCYLMIISYSGFDDNDIIGNVCEDWEIHKNFMINNIAAYDYYHNNPKDLCKLLPD